MTPLLSLTALSIVCFGGGAANKVDSTTGWASDNYGNSGQIAMQGTRSQQFADQVDVLVDGEQSKIRLPRTMLPPIRGGEDGWFKLKDLRVSETSITATAGVNFLNSPKVYLDRRTGTISINGKAGSYTGRCERVEVGAANKF
ncbi:hypothetical protein ACH0BU_17090 [Sphingomonas olei]